MGVKIWGIEHIIYFVAFVLGAAAVLIYLKKYAKTEQVKRLTVKCLAGVLLIAIVTNRISIVFKTEVPEWKWLIPDSFCGMSSLVLALAVLLGKKDNNVLHFVWLLALAGGVITMFYPEFLPQNPSIFYLPTISGLLHHSISAVLVLALLFSKNLIITYKKWYCTLFGFTSYLSFGCFLIYVLNFHDAYCIVNPILSGTPLTIWVIAPIYCVVYAFLLFIFELIRKQKAKKVVLPE